MQKKKSLNKKEKLDLIASILVCVKRDLILSFMQKEIIKKRKKQTKSIYNYIFTENALNLLNKSFIDDFKFDTTYMPLYGYKGDLMSQLSKMLICSKDFLPDKYINTGNDKINKILFLSKECKSNCNFIIKMRNAMSHSHFNVTGTSDDVKYIFWNERDKKINFYVEMSSENLMDFINILFEELTQYLLDNEYNPKESPL